MSSSHVSPHFDPRCKHQAYSMLQPSRSVPSPDTFHEYHAKGKKVYDINKCDVGGGGRDKS